MTTILLIDDHGLLRSALVIAIKTLFKAVEIIESDNIQSFRLLHTQKVPNLIITGINSRLWKVASHTIEQIREICPHSKLMVYDQHLDAESISSIFRMGVDGYLLQKSGVDQLAECIKNLLNGKRYLPTELFELLIPKLTENGRHRKIMPDLTVRESQIAAYLIQDIETGAIAKKLDRTPATISIMKRNILKKMNVRSIPELKMAFKNKIEQ